MMLIINDLPIASLIVLPASMKSRVSRAEGTVKLSCCRLYDFSNSLKQANEK